ncbi:hypothetical protein CPT_Mydo_079 [Proteus phage Mydo]|uniref:Uncharacterized protein n=1 Tax=Proteus phage Mydo TaxID=2483610 RepID=A0A3G8F0J6_9CAUD|nr:hypothetical protein HWB97_gp079 [Proteus phage Mydo]AZF87654.1 hypothetical protein CPT_Mydo_079 [Proteus phage Mydo]
MLSWRCDKMILLIITDVMINYVTISLLIVASTSHDNANENDNSPFHGLATLVANRFSDGGIII